MCIITFIQILQSVSSFLFTCGAQQSFYTTSFQVFTGLPSGLTPSLCNVKNRTWKMTIRTDAFAKMDQCTTLSLKSTCRPFDGDVWVFEAVDDGAAMSLHCVVVGMYYPQ